MAKNFEDNAHLVGTLFARYYLVSEVIANGGMGDIYLATSTLKGEQVAIKVLRPEFFEDEVIRARFDFEIKTAFALKHKHIVRVLDAGNEGGRAYIVMEFLEGENLEQRIRRLGTLPLDETIEIAKQVSSALFEAHSRNIIHRDLKPANIFLLQTPGTPIFVKILDFGIAKLQPQFETKQSVRLTAAGLTLGTPLYMAPEQIRSQPIDGRTDIYALATILWECVVGKTPYLGSTTPEILQKQLYTPIPEFPPDVAKRSSAHTKFGEVMCQCLDKTPENRPENMVVFRRMLESCLKPSVDTQTEMHIPTRAENTILHSPQERKGVKILIVGTILIILLMAGVFMASRLYYASTKADIEIEQNVTVKLISQPPGASVMLDDRVIATTPYSVDLSFAERKEIELVFSHPNFPPQVIRLHRHVDSDIEGVAVHLAKEYGTDLPKLNIKTLPNDAKVFINGTESLMRTPCEIPMTSWQAVTVVIEKKGYLRESYVVYPYGYGLEIQTTLFPVEMRQDKTTKNNEMPHKSKPDNQQK